MFLKNLKTNFYFAWNRKYCNIAILVEVPNIFVQVSKYSERTKLNIFEKQFLKNTKCTQTAKAS